MLIPSKLVKRDREKRIESLLNIESQLADKKFAQPVNSRTKNVQLKVYNQKGLTGAFQKERQGSFPYKSQTNTVSKDAINDKENTNSKEVLKDNIFLNIIKRRRISASCQSDNLLTQLNDLKANEAILVKEIVKKQEAYQNAEFSIKELSTIKENYEKKIEELNKENKEIKVYINDIQDVIFKLREENNKLLEKEKYLEQFDVLLKDRTKQLSDVKYELSEALETIKELKIENSNLKAELEKLGINY